MYENGDEVKIFEDIENLFNIKVRVFEREKTLS